MTDESAAATARTAANIAVNVFKNLGNQGLAMVALGMCCGNMVELCIEPEHQEEALQTLVASIKDELEYNRAKQGLAQ